MLSDELEMDYNKYFPQKMELLQASSEAERKNSLRVPPSSGTNDDVDSAWVLFVWEHGPNNGESRGCALLTRVSPICGGAGRGQTPISLPPSSPLSLFVFFLFPSRSQETQEAAESRLPLLFLFRRMIVSLGPAFSRQFSSLLPAHTPSV